MDCEIIISDNDEDVPEENLAITIDPPLEPDDIDKTIVKPELSNDMSTNTDIIEMPNKETSTELDDFEMIDYAEVEAAQPRVEYTPKEVIFRDFAIAGDDKKKRSSNEYDDVDHYYELIPNYDSSFYREVEKKHCEQMGEDGIIRSSTDLPLDIQPLYGAKIDLLDIKLSDAQPKTIIPQDIPKKSSKVSLVSVPKVFSEIPKSDLIRIEENDNSNKRQAEHKNTNISKPDSALRGLQSEITIYNILRFYEAEMLWQENKTKPETSKEIEEKSLLEPTEQDVPEIKDEIVTDKPFHSNLNPNAKVFVPSDQNQVSQFAFNLNFEPNRPNYNQKQLWHFQETKQQMPESDYESFEIPSDHDSNIWVNNMLKESVEDVDDKNLLETENIVKEAASVEDKPISENKDELLPMNESELPHEQSKRSRSRDRGPKKSKSPKPEGLKVPDASKTKKRHQKSKSPTPSSTTNVESIGIEQSVWVLRDDGKTYAEIVAQANTPDEEETVVVESNKITSIDVPREEDVSYDIDVRFLGDENAKDYEKTNVDVEINKNLPSQELLPKDSDNVLIIKETKIQPDDEIESMIVTTKQPEIEYSEEYKIENEFPVAHTKTYADIAAVERLPEPIQPVTNQNLLPKQHVQIRIEVVESIKDQPLPLQTDFEGFTEFLTRKDKRARSRSRSKSETQDLPKIPSKVSVDLIPPAASAELSDDSSEENKVPSETEDDTGVVKRSKKKRSRSKRKNKKHEQEDQPPVGVDNYVTIVTDSVDALESTEIPDSALITTCSVDTLNVSQPKRKRSRSRKKGQNMGELKTDANQSDAIPVIEDWKPVETYTLEDGTKQNEAAPESLNTQEEPKKPSRSKRKNKTKPGDFSTDDKPPEVKPVTKNISTVQPNLSKEIKVTIGECEEPIDIEIKQVTTNVEETRSLEEKPKLSRSQNKYKSAEPHEIVVEVTKSDASYKPAVVEEPILGDAPREIVDEVEIILIDYDNQGNKKKEQEQPEDKKIICVTESTLEIEPLETPQRGKKKRSKSGQKGKPEKPTELEHVVRIQQKESSIEEPVTFDKPSLVEDRAKLTDCLLPENNIIEQVAITSSQQEPLNINITEETECLQAPTKEKRKGSRRKDKREDPSEQIVHSISDAVKSPELIETIVFEENTVTTENLEPLKSEKRKRSRTRRKHKPEDIDSDSIPKDLEERNIEVEGVVQELRPTEVISVEESIDSKLSVPSKKHLVEIVVSEYMEPVADDKIVIRDDTIEQTQILEIPKPKPRKRSRSKKKSKTEEKMELTDETDKDEERLRQESEVPVTVDDVPFELEENVSLTQTSESSHTLDIPKKTRRKRSRSRKKNQVESENQLRNKDQTLLIDDAEKSPKETETKDTEVVVEEVTVTEQKVIANIPAIEEPNSDITEIIVDTTETLENRKKPRSKRKTKKGGEPLVMTEDIVKSDVNNVNIETLSEKNEPLEEPMVTTAVKEPKKGIELMDITEVILKPDICTWGNSNKKKQIPFKEKDREILQSVITTDVISDQDIVNIETNIEQIETPENLTSEEKELISKLDNIIIPCEAVENVETLPTKGKREERIQTLVEEIILKPDVVTTEIVIKTTEKSETSEKPRLQEEDNVEDLPTTEVILKPVLTEITDKLDVRTVEGAEQIEPLVTTEAILKPDTVTKEIIIETTDNIETIEGPTLRKKELYEPMVMIECVPETGSDNTSPFVDKANIIETTEKPELLETPYLKKQKHTRSKEKTKERAQPLLTTEVILKPEVFVENQHKIETFEESSLEKKEPLISKPDVDTSVAIVESIHTIVATEKAESLEKPNLKKPKRTRSKGKNKPTDRTEIIGTLEEPQVNTETVIEKIESSVTTEVSKPEVDNTVEKIETTQTLEKKKHPRSKGKNKDHVEPLLATEMLPSPDIVMTKVIVEKIETLGKPNLELMKRVDPVFRTEMVSKPQVDEIEPTVVTETLEKPNWKKEKRTRSKGKSVKPLDATELISKPDVEFKIEVMKTTETLEEPGLEKKEHVEDIAIEEVSKPSESKTDKKSNLKKQKHTRSKPVTTDRVQHYITTEPEVDTEIIIQKTEKFETIPNITVDKNFEPLVTTEVILKPDIGILEKVEKVEQFQEPNWETKERFEPFVTTEVVSKPDDLNTQTVIERTEKIERFLEPSLEGHDPIDHIISTKVISKPDVNTEIIIEKSEVTTIEKPNLEKGKHPRSKGKNKERVQHLASTEVIITPDVTTEITVKKTENIEKLEEPSVEARESSDVIEILKPDVGTKYIVESTEKTETLEEPSLKKKEVEESLVRTEVVSKPNVDDTVVIIEQIERIDITKKPQALDVSNLKKQKRSRSKGKNKEQVQSAIATEVRSTPNVEIDIEKTVKIETSIESDTEKDKSFEPLVTKKPSILNTEDILERSENTELLKRPSLIKQETIESLVTTEIILNPEEEKYKTETLVTPKLEKKKRSRSKGKNKEHVQSLVTKELVTTPDFNTEITIERGQKPKEPNLEIKEPDVTNSEIIIKTTEKIETTEESAVERPKHSRSKGKKKSMIMTEVISKPKVDESQIIDEKVEKLESPEDPNWKNLKSSRAITKLLVMTKSQMI
ncbi:hypothetical protein FQR65_LT06176 [Abscondita terminalis]|nr:hypothetical protein FQR65_LT06176 [Abscondita terminalis]